MAPVYRITDKVVLSGAFTPGPLPINTDFFLTPPVVAKDFLKPGKGGIMRVWFTVFTTGNADTAIQVIRKDPAGTTPPFPSDTQTGFVNADNDYKIKSQALYWFDVPIIEECTIQLRSVNSPDGLITAVPIVGLQLLEFQVITAGA